MASLAPSDASGALPGLYADAEPASASPLPQPLESAAALDDLPDHLPALVLDGSGSIVRLTSAARRMLRVDEGWAQAGTFFGRLHRNVVLSVMRDVADMVTRQKSRASWLLRVETRPGSWAWVRATAYNRLTLPLAGIVVVLQDFH